MRRGCHRAYLKRNPRIHAAGETRERALNDLSLTLKSRGRPSDLNGYDVEDWNFLDARELEDQSLSES